MPRSGVFFHRRACASSLAGNGMVLILPEHSQRPYRYGMTLLCVGAMFNWLGLADNNAEPVRYIGVALIAAGALLICLAMCFWMKATHDPQVAALQAEQDNMAHIVTIHRENTVLEKPPDYDTVTGALPPSYEDAIKLSPAQLQIDCTDSSGSSDNQKPAESTTTTLADNTTSCPHTPVNCSEAASSTSSPQGDKPEGGDNFGTRVLRISRKFLRGSRGTATDVENAVVATPDNSTTPTQNVEVVVR